MTRGARDQDIEDILHDKDGRGLIGNLYQLANLAQAARDELRALKGAPDPEKEPKPYPCPCMDYLPKPQLDCLCACCVREPYTKSCDDLPLCECRKGPRIEGVRG